jgi:hypothetical protein
MHPTAIASKSWTTAWMQGRCIAILPTVGLRYNGSASAAKDRRCIVVHRPTSHSVSRTAYNNASAVMSKTPDLKKKIDASRRPSFSNLPLCHAADAEPLGTTKKRKKPSQKTNLKIEISPFINSE